jgi:hypothetical protein
VRKKVSRHTREEYGETQKVRVEPQGRLKTTILPAQATLDSRAEDEGALRVRSVVSVAV